MNPLSNSVYSSVFTYNPNVLCMNIHTGATVAFNQSKYIVSHNIGIVHVQPVLVLNTSSSMNISINIKSKGKNRKFY